MKTLLLWDIDYTLIDAGHAGEHALKVALKNAFDIEDDLAWLHYFGRTDVWIARAILEHHFSTTTPENIQRFLDAYLDALALALHTPHTHILPGILDLLAEISTRSDIAQGLLTGNLMRGAKTKLNHHGLWSHFPFGAFADDAEQRNDLGPYALRRAQAHHGISFPPDRIFVIGDTPHDIACGKAIGARTLAVATGDYSTEQLSTHKPSILMENLADTQAFFAHLN